MEYTYWEKKNLILKINKIKCPIDELIFWSHFFGLSNTWDLEKQDIREVSFLKKKSRKFY